LFESLKRILHGSTSNQNYEVRASDILVNKLLGKLYDYPYPLPPTKTYQLPDSLSSSLTLVVATRPPFNPLITQVLTSGWDLDLYTLSLKEPPTGPNQRYLPTGQVPNVPFSGISLPSANLLVIGGTNKI
jgi:hypothetical protein